MEGEKKGGREEKIIENFAGHLLFHKTNIHAWVYKGTIQTLFTMGCS